jgi:hypothetical protein
MSPNPNFEYEEEKRGLFQRFGFAIGLIVVAVIVVALLRAAFSGGGSNAPRPREITMVNLTPLPPPPPPPPVLTPQTMPERKMTDVQPLDDQDAKAEDKPQDESSPGMGTGIKGPGGDNAFGLSSKGGSFFQGNGEGGGSHGNPFGRYFGEVRRKIQDALSRNPLTSKGKFSNKVRLWEDDSGRVTRAKLAGTTGDSALDAAINAALSGLLLDLPPEGLAMPIVIRVDARRP